MVATILRFILSFKRALFLFGRFYLCFFLLVVFSSSFWRLFLSVRWLPFSFPTFLLPYLPPFLPPFLPTTCLSYPLKRASQMFFSLCPRSFFSLSLHVLSPAFSLLAFSFLALSIRGLPLSLSPWYVPPCLTSQYKETHCGLCVRHIVFKYIHYLCR